ncbi:MAG TPA: hypothetical protein VIE65_15370 [Methylobacter sp.]
MKNFFHNLIAIMASFAAIITYAMHSYACTTPALAGSIGDTTMNPPGVPDSYITAIVANGTGIIQVTSFNSVTGVSTQKPFSVDPTNGITVTGSWVGSPANTITSIIMSGSQITFNGGPSKLTFAGGATWSTTAISWPSGGMTQWLSSNSTILSVEGFSGGHYSGASSTVTGTCPSGGKFIKVSSNLFYSCAIGEGGIVYCWGILQGTNTASGIPVPFSSTDIVGATGLSAGINHACALLHGGTSGTVSCWGDNSSGQLGDGTTTSRGNPLQVPGILGAISVAAGGDHTCVVLSSGAVKCWGGNAFGQCGTGSTTSSFYTTPQTVPTITSGAHYVSNGNGMSIAMVNGRAYTWGQNPLGALGIGGPVDSNPHATPIQLTSLGTTVSIVGAGNYGNACSISTSGVLSCWGYNQFGAVGNGTLGNPITSPTTVPGITASTIIPPSMGSLHSCAITSTNGAKCWGYNNSTPYAGRGEVGVDPYQADPLTPVQVSGITTGASSVGAGWTHSCFVLNGHVFCSGDNQYGQLGNGSSTNSDVALLVTGT